MSVESRRPSTDTRFDSVIIGRESKLNLEALKGRQFLHGSRGQNECHLSVSVLGNISTTFLALSVGGNISTFNYHTIKCV